MISNERCLQKAVAMSTQGPFDCIGLSTPKERIMSKGKLVHAMKNTWICLGKDTCVLLWVSADL